MSTLQAQVETANLSKECKVDLMNHVEQIELASSVLPKRQATMADQHLPVAVTASTVSRLNKSHEPSVNESSRQRYLSQKKMQTESLAAVSTYATQTSNEHFKKHKITFRGQPSGEDPFRNSRTREELNGRDEDFVYRYAEALTKSKIEREPRTDEASVAAVEAYTKAFRSYTGRDPTPKDLEEVGKVYFAFDENGDIGVVQKPHSCHPHSHVTCCHRRPVRCANQVYKDEVPAVRAARDRFPGPIPVWSSTKNLHHMTGGDMHIAGHQNTASLKMKNAVSTMVAPK